MGYGIVAIFVASWLVSMAYWKDNKFEQKYGALPMTNSSINSPS